MSREEMILSSLVIVTEQSLAQVLDYLKADVGHCLYMYIDIKKYGLNHPEMCVWAEMTENDVSLVVMKYYNSISFYSRADTWAEADVIALLKQFNPASVSSPLALMEKIHPSLSNYSLGSGWIFEYQNFKEFPFEGLTHGKKEDMREVAELLCSDEGFGAIYEVDNLQAQLEERLETGMGRNLIIRNEEEDIVAQIATYAECDQIAITSGMIVDPQYRQFMYGTILESNMVRELKEEGFRVFTFVIEKKRKKLLDSLKQISIGQYGRLTLETKE